MRNRRDFMRKAGLLTVGLPLIGSQWACKNKETAEVKSTVEEAVKQGFTLDQFGIQLWTVREAMAEDPKGVLKQLADYGYDSIESFQSEQGVFWGMTAKEYKAYLDDLGMVTYSTHCDPSFALDPTKRDEFKQLADDGAEIGLKYLINPFLGFIKEKDEFKKAIDGFNDLQEICKERGMNYAYHNHHYSFRDWDGDYPQDMMMQGTADSGMAFEMDIYWVVTAGEDPIKWIEKYPNRFQLSHVKDRYKPAKLSEIEKEEGIADGFEVNASCILGEGQIDFDKILSVGKENGMKYFIVEQERYDGVTPLEAAEKDADYMEKFKA